MALKWGDRILETATTTGTGAFTLAGAVTGHQRFSAVCSTNDTCYYSIFAVDANGNPSGDWETGLGTYSGTNTLTRTTVSQSSNANAAVSFAAGTKYVMITAPATVMDVVGASTGATQGDLLYRGASGWARLAAGTSGYVLTAAGAGANPAWAAAASGGATVSTQTGTSYTAVLGDANTYIRFSNASAITFTIPPNASVAFPVGTVIEMEQTGAGALTVAPDSGVTVNSRSSDLTLAGQYAVAFVKKVATDTWTMNGDL